MLRKLLQKIVAVFSTYVLMVAQFGTERVHHYTVAF